jgi:hypothetical protein
VGKLLTNFSAPLSSVLSSSLLLGDTTSNQALIFSPPLLPAPQSQPTYPNYTFPSARLDRPALPEFNLPTLDLIVVPTSSSPTIQGLDQSQCAVQGANVSTGGLAEGARNMVVNATTEWSAVGGVEGYRTYWVLGGLLPGTNYTAWYTDGENALSQPIWFRTKQCELPFFSLLHATYKRKAKALKLCSSIIPLSASITKRPLPIYRLRRPPRIQLHLDPIFPSPDIHPPRPNHRCPHIFTRLIRHYPLYERVRS